MEEIKSLILYEDSHIYVCHKPAGMLSQPDRSFAQDMASALLAYGRKKGDNNIFITPINRLDRPVEGIVLYARSKQAAATLTAQMKDGEMNKCYYAVVEAGADAEDGANVKMAYADGEICVASSGLAHSACGEDSVVEIEKGAQPEAGEGVRLEADAQPIILEDYLLKDAKTNTSRVVDQGTQGAKLARLEYTVLASKGGRLLLKVRLYTGRHHQIRVQLAYAGMPLVGDCKYNTVNMAEGRKERKSEVGQEERALSLERNRKEKGFNGLALCAYSLEFTHPVTGKEMSFTVKPKGEVFGEFDF